VCNDGIRPDWPGTFAIGDSVPGGPGRSSVAPGVTACPASAGFDSRRNIGDDARGGDRFLTVMDGMTLFTRLQVRRAEALLAAGRKVDGYYRTLSLITAADSVCPAAPEWLTLYGGGRQAELILRDSVLVYRAGAFLDTLSDGVCLLRLEKCTAAPDTVQVGFGAGFTAGFPVPAPARLYRIVLDEIEEGYGYEE
jgi:hypothetical protein